MPISPTVSNTGPQPVSTTATGDAGKTRSASGNPPADAVAGGVRSQMNVQILQASLDVSIQAGDNSQAALFSAAIDKINGVLAPDLGPNALQAALGQDNSPEATAGRIVGLSTAFFDAYAANHPGQDPETLAQNFVDMIRGGFEKGYGEAQDLLKGLGVLSGDIANGITKTYDLVHKGLDDFLTAKLALLAGNRSDSGGTTSGTTGSAGGGSSSGSDTPQSAAS